MPGRLKERFFFDFSANEVTKNLQAVLFEELNASKRKNLPIVYKNSLCINKNQFIHEYPDGRKFLIRQSRINSEEKVIRQL
jgi:hypothetical protein